MLQQLPRPAKRAPAKPTKPKEETKKQREARLKKARAAQKQLRQRLAEDDDAVLTLVEWAALNGISLRVARSIIASDKGPVITRLSARRLGVSRKAHREWLETRAR
jgi:hypothetical protein